MQSFELFKNNIAMWSKTLFIIHILVFDKYYATYVFKNNILCYC